jgi:hypothetical protein
MSQWTKKNKEKTTINRRIEGKNKEKQLFLREKERDTTAKREPERKRGKR